MTDLYAVLGHPISHSKSPQIHTLFAGQTGEDLLYRAVLVPLDGFADEVSKLIRQQGMTGMNVTVPFKEEAFQLAQQRTPRAERAGAVNTLKVLSNGTLLADNTDGAGLIRDITVNQGVSLKGKQVLVLGAGGAVRGILQPLLEQQPAAVVIANRTVSKAEALAADFADLGRISGCGFAEATPPDGSAFDVIINGTSASLAGELPPLTSSVIGPETVCYDMMYGKGLTVFNRWAREHGAARVIDGLGMLVEQAAEAFELWRGVRPDTAPVMAELRGERRR
tara:strand:+ start:3231 stop:4070 length:840 start_codon:yes stop_codon:yes gene_type:complete